MESPEAPKKLKLHTPDFTEANIAKLVELFPHCATETRDENERGSQAEPATEKPQTSEKKRKITSKNDDISWI